MKKLFTLLTFIFSLSILALSPQEIQRIQNLIKSDKTILIDVREEDEIKKGMLEKAVSFPLSKTQTNKNWIHEVKEMAGSKKIILYCRSGARAEKLKTLLKEENISSQNIGGFLKLKEILPTKKGHK